MDLPTGAKIEYDHGAGLAAFGTGYYSSGQVLDNHTSTYQNCPSPCASIPNPLWRPFIYRRLLTRKEYASGGTTVTQTRTYSTGESVTSTSSLFPGLVSGVSISAGTEPRVEVITSGSGLTTNITTRHTFHPDGSFPYQATLSPIAAAFPPLAGVIFRPPVFQGKEYKTEVVGFQRTERVFAEDTSTGAAPACQENISWLDGAGTKTSIFLYDRDSAGSFLPTTLRSGNLTHLYEYGSSAAWGRP